ncbi:MAG: hypothetical protein SF029_14535 [bacterium]|nr:hypothetical protein [bacterium]
MFVRRRKLSRQRIRHLCFAFSFTIFVFSSTVLSQPGGTPPDTLASPHVETYLRAVPDIMTSLVEEQAQSSLLASVIDAEFAARYPDLDGATFKLLFDAYRALDDDNYGFFEQRPYWNQRLVMAWMDEHQIDLDKTEQFAFENYTVRVEPRDFNADGIHEWLLDVQAPRYMQLLVVKRDAEGYTLVPTSLPYFTGGLQYSWTASGFMEEQLFEDLNNDGLPEWVLAVGGYGADNMTGGYLQVLQWQDNRLISVAPENYPDTMSYEAPAGAALPLFPFGVTVSFEDDDEDGSREIVILQHQGDNWGCNWLLRRVFAWNGARYELAKTERSYDAVRGCEIRRAEEAFWMFDYTTAINHYERAFTLPPGENTWFVEQSELDRYATARMALAYTFAGQDEKAASAIRSLPARSSDPKALADLIVAVKQHLGDVRAMCDAAYEAFHFEFETQDGALGSPLNTIVGTTLENNGDPPGHPRNSYPTPSHAGCDLALPLRNELSASPLRIDSPPADQLVARGYPVQRATAFDLDGDGIESWIIEFTQDIVPLVLHPVDGVSGYQVTFDSERRLRYAFARPMPDGSGIQLLTLGSTSCPPQRRTGEPGHSEGSGQTVILWGMTANELIEMERIIFCEDTSPGVFMGSDGDTLPWEVRAWIKLSAPSSAVLGATLSWDSATKTYLPFHIQPQPFLVPDYTVDTYDALYDGRKALRQGDVQQTLEIVETGLSNSHLEPDVSTALRYMRAVALELLNQSEQALAEYDAIYQAAPDSAWGQLAALHVQR